MIKLLSLFSGIGAFESALDRIGCRYQLTGYCEIDPYASKSYAQIHGASENLNLHDVTTIDTALISLLGGADLITYGFPCQDISVAGKRRGFTDENGNRTRSGLFFEALRIIKDLQPKYAIAENVKALTSKKFEKEFKTVLDSLDAAGYNNYWQVLNAKDYGIPQNRERVFIISIRKDCDAGLFSFPAPQELKPRLKDMLEPEVDDKYYLTGESAQRLIQAYAARINEAITEPAARILQVGNLIPNAGRKFTNPQRGRVYDPDGLAPTLNTMQGGGLEPKIIEPHANIIVRAGTLGKHERDQERTHKDNYLSDSYRIRKLTPRECWRCMGFTDA